MVSSKLFEPINVGAVQLQHRVVLAPMTRFKATEKEHVPHAKLVKEYYAQRGSTPGTLLITEASFIARKAGVYKHAPGLWSNEQQEAWKEVTDAVHEKGSFIFAQLWALGRAADSSALQEEDPSLSYVAPSPIGLPGKKGIPRALTVEEIKEFVQLYAQAAAKSIDQGGFDGVEIHGANGYLIDQFLQSVSNTRTDEYGGSVENYARFALEVVGAVVDAVGAERTAIRLSPWETFQGMGLEDPKPVFSYLVSQLKERHPSLAYIHVTEPRVNGDVNRESGWPESWSNDFIRDIWDSPRRLISAGGYSSDSAIAVADRTDELIAFGRHFIANPDLVVRLKNNIPLNPYNRATFYIPGDKSEGYTDYPFAEGSDSELRAPL